MTAPFKKNARSTTTIPQKGGRRHPGASPFYILDDHAIPNFSVKHPEVLTVAIAIDVSLLWHLRRRGAIFGWDLLRKVQESIGVLGINGVLESWKMDFTWIFF
jgi:hypothetical protein